ncbi:MAG: DNA-packaging protein [Rhizobiaceae bacterium]|nr:DNA-packaging protein [Rhizobiaceae bacterium]
MAPGEPDELARAFVAVERNEYGYTWSQHAHRGQIPPPGDWSVWLIMAGRGFGKTRAGAEWVRLCAEYNPAARIALVAATLGEARSVMVEGESGILACSPENNRPLFEPSLRRITWSNGAQATLYSALEPESLRGPQHSHGCRPGAEGIYREPIAITGRPVAACRN